MSESRLESEILGTGGGGPCCHGGGAEPFSEGGGWLKSGQTNKMRCKSNFQE